MRPCKARQVGPRGSPIDVIPFVADRRSQPSAHQSRRPGQFRSGVRSGRPGQESGMPHIGQAVVVPPLCHRFGSVLRCQGPAERNWQHQYLLRYRRQHKARLGHKRNQRRCHDAIRSGCNLIRGRLARCGRLFRSGRIEQDRRRAWRRHMVGGAGSIVHRIMACRCSGKPGLLRPPRCNRCQLRPQRHRPGRRRGKLQRCRRARCCGDHRCGMFDKHVTLQQRAGPPEQSNDSRLMAANDRGDLDTCDGNRSQAHRECHTCQCSLLQATKRDRALGRRRQIAAAIGADEILADRQPNVTMAGADPAAFKVGAAAGRAHGGDVAPVIIVAAST
jgi:hypothetical protein